MTSRIYITSFLCIILIIGFSCATESKATESASPSQLKPRVNQVDRGANSDVNTEVSSVEADTEKSINTALRLALQQKINALHAENANTANQEIALLEQNAQRIFWVKCLICVLSLLICAASFSFWRIHIQRQFQQGLAGISSTLMHFQDSLFSLLDTSQFSADSTLSSFYFSTSDIVVADEPYHTTKQKLPPVSTSKPSKPSTPTTPATPITTTSKIPSELTPPKEDLSDIKGFVDAWLKIYKPDSEDTLSPNSIIDLAHATSDRPKSPMHWLNMVDVYRNENDRSNFDLICLKIKKLFNLKVQNWEDTEPAQEKQFIHFPHVVNKILELWHSDSVVTYIERLLYNSRLSPREGFGVTMYRQLEELLVLSKDPHRPRQLHQLKGEAVAAFLFQTSETVESPRSHNSVVPDLELGLQVKAESPPTTSVSALKTSTDTAALAEHEVRLKLATAYLEIGDSEGACLLLEDVIKDTPNENKHKQDAQHLLKSIEEKQPRFCGNSEALYF
ncbi:MAG: hypothetical protein K2P84_12900 [Undibacterium sp.]|nr:hypothetical protein [Undibacterium sp.]